MTARMQRCLAEQALARQAICTTVARPAQGGHSFAGKACTICSAVQVPVQQAAHARVITLPADKMLAPEWLDGPRTYHGSSRKNYTF